MADLSLHDPRVRFTGALDLDERPTGVIPRRLPAWTRSKIPGLFMDAVLQMPSGVRIELVTSSTTIELDVHITRIRQDPYDARPAVFDLVIDDALVAQVESTTGSMITIGGFEPGDLRFDTGDATTIRFEQLGSEDKHVEIWLPQAAIVEVQALGLDEGSHVSELAPSARPRWVHYGSSISHCMEAESPTGIWPAVAARAVGAEVWNLGFAGQCMLDPFVATTVRDLPADAISLKVGINIVNGDTMSTRTFAPSVHGFLDTVRNGHPETPVVLVSPIYCPSVEEHPGPTGPGPDGLVVSYGGTARPGQPELTLTAIREILRDIVALRRAEGDVNLTYVDGLELFGPEDVGDLPDLLHPNAAGYERMGRRFAALAFGHGGPFGPVVQRGPAVPEPTDHESGVPGATR